eukprot:jgi/Ulvmu1/1526/UM011_0256.1
MGNSPDDEAFARELHRELNVGPRRRQRRQPAPSNRSNPPQKRARSAGSSGIDSTTNDDSDDFSDRLIHRPPSKSGQRRASEPQDDGQAESSHNAIGQLQRSQTAPPSGSPGTRPDAGTAAVPRRVVPGIPQHKTEKLSMASAASKPSNVALQSKHSAPAIPKRTTPPKSPRHKRPKSSIPAPPRHSKDNHSYRPAVQVGAQRAGAQLPSAAGGTHIKPVQYNRLHAPSGTRPSAVTGQMKQAPRVPQAAAPARQSISQDDTSDDEAPPIPRAPKERPVHAPTPSIKLEKPHPMSGHTSKVIQSKGITNKAAPAAANGAPRCGPKPAIDQGQRPAPLKHHSRPNDHKPMLDAWTKASVQDDKPRVRPEQRQPSVKAMADQGTPVTPSVGEEKAAPQEAAASTPQTSPSAPVATSAPLKAIAPVPDVAGPTSRVITPASGPVVPVQKSAKPLATGAMPVRKVGVGIAQPAEAPAQQAAVPPPEVKHTAESGPAETRAAMPRPKVGKLAKAYSVETAVPNGPAGHKQDTADTEHRSPPGLRIQSLPHSEHPKPETCMNQQLPAADGQLQDCSTKAKESTEVQIKVEADRPAGPPAVAGSNTESKNSAYEFMNLCPAHSEVGSLLCQEAGSDFCVWLRADDIASRMQLGAALGALYPGAVAAQTGGANADVTLVNLRGRQYFHFPANSETSSQGNVPWQEATAQATHMLLTV